jgi:hypothetical protein
MKRIFLILAAGLVTMTSTGGTGLARSRQSTAPRDRITELKAFSGLKSLTLVAMNDNGDIVGNAREDKRSVIVVDLAAGTRSAHLLILQKPSGLTNVSASGINDAGIVSAQAWRSSGHRVPFVVFFHGRGHIWWQLPGRQASYEVAGIAANGDVAGTMMSSSGLAERAVEWFFQPGYEGPVARPYAAAFSLKRSPGFTRSSASSIWSNGRRSGYASRELIGGMQYRGNRPSNRFTIWRWLNWCPNEFGCSQPAQSGKLTGHLQSPLLPIPFMIGGWGRHIYAAGRQMGVDTGSGWRSTIRFTGTGAKLGSLVGLPVPTHHGAECFYGANNVSASKDGKFVGVGGISCTGGLVPPEALMWHGTGVIRLRSRVAAGSGWHLNDAAAINSHGQIVGTGTLNGRTAVYLLRS